MHAVACALHALHARVAVKQLATDCSHVTNQARSTHGRACAPFTRSRELRLNEEACLEATPSDLIAGGGDHN